MSADGYSIANMIIPPGTIRIKLLRSVVVEGIQGTVVGGIYEVTHSIARTLICMGAAEEVAEIKAAPVIVENRDPVVETRDPQPAER